MHATTGPARLNRTSGSIYQAPEIRRLQIEPIGDKATRQPYCLKVCENQKTYLFYFKDHGNQKKGDCLEGDNGQTYPMPLSSFERLFPSVLICCKEIPCMSAHVAELEEMERCYNKYCNVPHLVFNPETNSNIPSCIIVKGEPNDNGGYFLMLKDGNALKNLYSSEHIVSTVELVGGQTRDVPLTEKEFERVAGFVRQQMDMIREKYALTRQQSEAIEVSLSELNEKRDFITMLSLNLQANDNLYPYFRVADADKRYYFFSIENEFKVEFSNGTFQPMGDDDFNNFLSIVIEAFDSNDQLSNSIKLSYADFKKKQQKCSPGNGNEYKKC